MPHKLKSLLISLFIILIFISMDNVPIMAQDASKMGTEELDSLSLDQLLDIDLLQVASKKPMGRKEIPGTVTIITRDEILNSGARDMIDVLNLVPGFAFAVDVQGVTSLGNRGNWADEGKVLVMVDGVPMNELLYGTVPFGNRFPVDLIERVEIIRGPGSSFYGGFAELAVINVITLSPSDLSGVRVSGSFGQMGDLMGQRNLTLAIGKQFDNFGFSGSLFIGEANRSTGTYTGFDSTSFSMAGNNVLKPFTLNLGANYEQLKARLIIENYNTTQYDGLDVLAPAAVETDFPSLNADLSYDIKLTKSITLTPQLSYTQQKPYLATDPLLLDSVNQVLYNDKLVQRTTGSLTLSGDVAPFLFLTLGAEANYDNTKALGDLESNLYDNDATSVSYHNVGVYLQSLWTTKLVNVNAGIRFDKYSGVEAAFVPWIGITKIVDKFNFKLLYGQNFRAPAIMNIQLNPEIKPEKTTAVELEAGYQLFYNTVLSVNLFNVTIKDPIVYGVINDQEEYYNYSRTGTQGIEFDFMLKDVWGYIYANYSFYTANNNQVDQYTIPGNDNALLAFAQHKGTINASTPLFDGLINLDPSVVLFGNRYGFDGVDADGNSIIHEFKPVALANLFLTIKNTFERNLDTGIGVYDIFNQEYDYLQPYDGGHAPLPGPSREFAVRLSYDFKWR